MALEIKGLRAGTVRMRGNIEKLTGAINSFNEVAEKHVGDVGGLTAQVQQHSEDLEFAVNSLGNFVEEADDGEKKPPPAEKKEDGSFR
jgi:hypothetical protein